MKGYDEFLTRNMFSSEKVLQMSYANYQCVHNTSLLILHSFELIGAKKHWSKNSKTPASWTNERLGGPKFSTPSLDLSRGYQNHSQHQLISGERSVVLLTEALYTSLALDVGRPIHRCLPIILFVANHNANSSILIILLTDIVKIQRNWMTVVST